MVTFTWTRLAAVAGGLAVSLAAGAGIASADPVSDPDVDRVINSNCTYDQAVAALNAENSQTAAEFNSSPIAQGFLHQFVDAPHDQRVQLANQIQAMPGAAPYFATMKQVAKVCNKY